MCSGVDSGGLLRHDAGAHRGVGEAL